MESWMISAGSGLLAVAFGYGIVRNRLESLESNANAHLSNDSLYHTDMNRKLDAQFKRIDDVSNKCIVLESKVSNMLDNESANKKFVSKDELTLHLRSIDKELAHMTKNSDVMVGKLDDLTNAFSSYMLRELNEGDTK